MVLRIISGGVTLINGTGYKISGGKTLINGTGQNITFGKSINTVSVGDKIYMTVGGVRTEFLVLHKGNPNTSIYDSSCDGIWVTVTHAPDVTMLFYAKNPTGNSIDYRYNPYTGEQYYEGIIYNTSNVHQYMNSTYYQSINNIQRKYIKTVKIPYMEDTQLSVTYNTKENGVIANVFSLCDRELTPNTAYYAVGSVLNYFSNSGLGDDNIRSLLYSTETCYCNYWVRDSTRNWDDGSYDTKASYISNKGGFRGTSKWEGNRLSELLCYIRPTMILSYDTKLDSNNTVIG